MAQSFTRLFESLIPRRRRSRRRSLSVDERRLVESNNACPSCGRAVDPRELAVHLFVCPHCQHHYRINALERVKVLLDGGEINEFFSEVKPVNPIAFPGYDEKIAAAAEKSGLDEALLAGVGRIEGRSAVFAIMSFTFLGGSMGSVVGERIAQAILYAAENKLPCIIFTASGGARMQEGIYSLMQMAKTSHAAALLAEAGMPLFVVLTDPTTGGVTASFAMLGDVTLAEPEALIGFAGPRVIEGTIRQKLPEGFQRSEFQRDKGFVDIVVPRKDMRSTLAYLIDTHVVEGSE